MPDRTTIRTLPLALLLAATAACSGDSASDSDAFPDDFLFGAATAGFQVDMGCPTLHDEQCVDDASDWYDYVTDPAMIAEEVNHLSGEDPAVVGPGHWELYETDYDLAADVAGLNAHRSSIEWSRLFPTSTVGIEGHDALRAVADPDALATYHAMFAAQRARGLTPLVTLHHYTLPLWIHDGIACHNDLDRCAPRGWLDPDLIVPEIAKYAGFCAREFGAYVDWWATQNEPFAVVLPGFLQPTAFRTNPPAVMLRTAEAKLAMSTMIEAHARMVDALREDDTVDADGDGTPLMAGLVYAMAPVRPADPDNPDDVAAADNVFYLWNMAFLNAVAAGMFDPDLDGEAVYREDLAGRMDFVGVNYKTRVVVQGLPDPLLVDLSPLSNFNPLTLQTDEIYPPGIYEMLQVVRTEFDLPAVITEHNGQHVPQGDLEREAQLVVESFAWLQRALADGIDVRGYFYWALMDNYEWNHGTDIPLGLFAVDPADPDKTRTARPTAVLLARIAAAGGIDDALLEEYGVTRPPAERE